MMPQRDLHELSYEQAEPMYEGYRGEQERARPLADSPRAESAKEEQTSAAKTHDRAKNERNMLRIGLFFATMVMILVFAVLFVFFLGGVGGWISFVVAAGIIFIL